MKTIAFITINLLLTLALNTGCHSTNADSTVSIQEDRSSARKNDENKKMKNQPDQPLQLRISMKEAVCLKTNGCQILLDIHNVSDDAVELGGLTLIMRPFASDSAINDSAYINSTLNVETLENIQLNQPPARSVIKPGQRLEKEIDLKQIKWLKTNQSSWVYKDLWDLTETGKYEISAQLKMFPKGVEAATRKEKIGDVEVEFKDSYKVTSDLLTLDLTKN